MLAKKILDYIPVSIRTIRRLFAQTIDTDLTFQQFRILYLVSDGMGATQMSHALNVSTAAISKIVEALLQKGYLTKEQGDDRRSQKLILTRLGDKTLKSSRKKVATELDKNIKKLSQKEQQELFRGLDVLHKLMEYVNEK